MITLEHFNYADAGPWAESEDEALVLSSEPKLVFEKEALPVGNYNKPDGPKDGFDITSLLLANIVKNHNRMVANGVRVPYQMGHEGDGNQLGNVVKASIKKNKKGIDSLFLAVEFADEAAKTKGLRHDVSVHVPSSFTDAKRNTYNRPLRHLAGTGYPVVPGLEDWQPITASYVTEEDLQMSMLKAIGTALELSFEDGEHDDDRKKKVLDAISALRKTKKAEEPVKLSQPVLKTLKGARELVLSSMVGKNITPAVKDELVKQFCGEEAISLSFSEASSSNGDFENIVSILEKNTCVPLSNPEEGDLVLSHGAKDDPMEIELQRRIEEAKSTY